jgi:hypothetical protein
MSKRVSHVCYVQQKPFQNAEKPHSIMKAQEKNGKKWKNDKKKRNTLKYGQRWNNKLPGIGIALF